jgi:hypothetical protein
MKIYLTLRENFLSTEDLSRLIEEVQAKNIHWNNFKDGDEFYLESLSSEADMEFLFVYHEDGDILLSDVILE